MLFRFIAGPILNLILAAAAWKKEAVTIGGSIGGFIIGTALFAAGGFLVWVVLGVFFVGSTILSRYKKKMKEQYQFIHSKHDRRDFVQVFANGGIGAVWAVLYLVLQHPMFLVGCIASYAAANADTWASEIGILSKTSPRSIVTGKPLEAGMSGGVTRLGFNISFVGAGVIALLFFAGLTLYDIFSIEVFPGILALSSVKTAVVSAIATVIIAFAGFLGSITDSFLGATIQAQYRDEKTGNITERAKQYETTPDSLITGKEKGKNAASKKVKNHHIRGFRWMSNDTVNFISIIVASSLAVLAFALVYGAF